MSDTKLDNDGLAGDPCGKTSWTLVQSLVNYFDTPSVYPMRLGEMQKEENQVRSIKGLQIGKIGFISTGGYEETPKTYDCIVAEELYNI